MLDEQDVLTSMVLDGCSVRYATKVQRALRTLPADQRLLCLQVYAWPLGQCPYPYLPRPDLPVEGSPDAPLGLY